MPVRESVGMRLARGADSFAQRFAQEIVARFGFDGDELVEVFRLEEFSQARVIDILGLSRKFNHLG